MLTPFDKWLITLQPCRWKFLEKNCSRLLIVFCRHLCEKCQTWVSEPHFGKLKVTHDFGWWLIRNPMVDFLFVLIEPFLYLLRFRGYGVKCVRLGCFRRGSTSLHSNFTKTLSSPINHSWHQKTKGTELPDNEDRIPLRSLVLTQYRDVTDRRMDGRTDRRTDGFAVTYTALAERCKKAAIS